jgi:hypothetical protein
MSYCRAIESQDTRDDLYRPAALPACRARWVDREPGRIPDLGLAELGEGEMTSHDISTFLAILFCVLVAMLTGWLSLRAIE